jgi:hypothetical protein
VCGRTAAVHLVSHGERTGFLFSDSLLNLGACNVGSVGHVMRLVLAMECNWCWPWNAIGGGRGMRLLLAMEGDCCWPWDAIVVGHVMRLLLAMECDCCWPCDAIVVDHGRGLLLAVGCDCCWPCDAIVVGHGMRLTINICFFYVCKTTSRCPDTPKANDGDVKIMLGYVRL